MSSSEGILFNPERKQAIDRSGVNISLDDYIAENRKARARARAAEGKKPIRNGRKRTNDTSSKNKKVSKRQPRQERRDSKKESQKDTKAPSKKNIEIKIQDSALHEILNNIGIDTKDYNVRLVATKKT